tara:strand:+ start:4588 stop:6219 length:1632 start_codon:yes stop_codon:yes gene_type:complete
LQFFNFFLKSHFLLLFFIHPFSSIADDNYEIYQINKDRLYYNLIIIDNIYVSSNEGLFTISPDFKTLSLFDNSLLSSVNSDFSLKKSSKISFILSPIELPFGYDKTVTDFAYFGNFLCIISKGDLLIFKKNLYEFVPFGSVRSLSKNSIGSYGRVLINGKELEKINYTDGQIKEFDSITFICYNGLLSVKNRKESILYDNNNSKNANAVYGDIIDIFSLTKTEFIVISNKGIYKYDLSLNEFNLIYSNKSEIIPIRNKIESRIKFSNEFHFIDENQYMVLDTNSLLVSNYLDFSMDIIAILEDSNDGSFFYALDDKSNLFTFSATINGLQIQNTKNLDIQFHTISDYGDFLFLTGNSGLGIFNKSIKKFYKNVIIDEFNKNAVFKSKDEIKFGSVHGFYKFYDVNKFIKSSLLIDYKVDTKSNISIYFFVGLLIFATALILVYGYNKKPKNLSNEERIIELKMYILKNLNNVTLKTLSDNFDMDYHALNNLQKEFIPAQFIKRLRQKKAKELFLKNKSFVEISKITGYSVTYLKKYKYKFLKL